MAIRPQILTDASHDPLQRRLLEVSRAIVIDSVLFNYAPGRTGEEYHPIREEDGLLDIMGDEEDRGPGQPPNPQELTLQVATCDGV
jgi:hypothetical protein